MNTNYEVFTMRFSLIAVLNKTSVEKV